MKHNRLNIISLLIIIASTTTLCSQQPPHNRIRQKRVIPQTTAPKTLAQKLTALFSPVGVLGSYWLLKHFRSTPVAPAQPSPTVAPESTNLTLELVVSAPGQDPPKPTRLSTLKQQVIPVIPAFTPRNRTTTHRIPLLLIEPPHSNSPLPDPSTPRSSGSDSSSNLSGSGHGSDLNELSEDRGSLGDSDSDGEKAHPHTPRTLETPPLSLPNDTAQVWPPNNPTFGPRIFLEMRTSNLATHQSHVVLREKKPLLPIRATIDPRETTAARHVRDMYVRDTIEAEEEITECLLAVFENREPYEKLSKTLCTHSFKKLESYLIYAIDAELEPNKKKKTTLIEASVEQILLRRFTGEQLKALDEKRLRSLFEELHQQLSEQEQALVRLKDDEKSLEYQLNAQKEQRLHGSVTRRNSDSLPRGFLSKLRSSKPEPSRNLETEQKQLKKAQRLVLHARCQTAIQLEMLRLYLTSPVETV